LFGALLVGTYPIRRPVDRDDNSSVQQAIQRPAVFDRLTFAGQIIETGTTSYRLAHARQRRAAG